MDGISIAGFAAWYASFLFSTTLHEAAHAWAAKKGGDNTAYLAGSATLNPLPHIEREKFGMIIAPIATYLYYGGNWMFGWASAPFDQYWAARRPGRALIMSLAGPLSHLLPAGAAFILLILGRRFNWFNESTGFSQAIQFLLFVLLRLNLVLLVFNLMPLPPLDGSEIWFLLIKSESERIRWRMIFHQYSLAGILLAWHFFPLVFIPVQALVIRTMSWATTF